MCHSLSAPAATEGLEQLYLNMIDLNEYIIDIIVKVYLLFVTELKLYVYKSNVDFRGQGPSHPFVGLQQNDDNVGDYCDSKYRRK